MHYIDPPYNTYEKWEYNDNVNSEEIKAWLGKTVGKAEDLSRHDKRLYVSAIALVARVSREDE